MNSMNNLLLNRLKICHNLRKYRNCRTIWWCGHSIGMKSKQNIESKANQIVRHIFGFPLKPPSNTSKVQKYCERRLLGFDFKRHLNDSIE